METVAEMYPEQQPMMQQYTPFDEHTADGENQANQQYSPAQQLANSVSAYSQSTTFVKQFFCFSAL